MELSESLSPSEQHGCSRPPGGRAVDDADERGVVGGCCGDEDDEGVSVY